MILISPFISILARLWWSDNIGGRNGSLLQESENPRVVQNPAFKTEQKGTSNWGMIAAECSLHSFHMYYISNYNKWHVINKQWISNEGKMIHQNYIRQNYWYTLYICRLRSTTFVSRQNKKRLYGIIFIEGIYCRRVWSRDNANSEGRVQGWWRGGWS